MVWHLTAGLSCEKQESYEITTDLAPPLLVSHNPERTVGWEGLFKACFPRESVLFGQTVPGRREHRQVYNPLQLHQLPHSQAPRWTPNTPLTPCILWGCSSPHNLKCNFICGGQTLVSFLPLVSTFCILNLTVTPQWQLGYKREGKRYIPGPNILLKDKILGSSLPPCFPRYHFFESPHFLQCQPLGTNL